MRVATTDMLAALKMVERRVTAAPDELDFEPAELARIRAAIAKAEGLAP